MKKVIRLTEDDLTRLVRRVIKEQSEQGADLNPLVSEQIKTLSNSQERLFAFLKGVVEMSSGGGMGWKASDGPGVKLTSNMLGSHLNKYNDLYGGGKVELGKPLSWDLYPLNPQQFPKAEGVKCSLVNSGIGLYIELEGGTNNASKIEATGGSGYLTTPGSVEDALLSMKNIYQNYKTAMNPRIK
jgi:hypothetical protein